MRFFLDFLHQKVPIPGKELPLYYRKALVISEILLSMPFFVGRIFIVESISGIVVSVVCADNNFFTKFDGFGGDISKFVPRCVLKDIKEFLSKE